MVLMDRPNKIPMMVFAGLGLVFVGLLIFYIWRRAKRSSLEAFEEGENKVMNTSTNVEMSAVLQDDVSAYVDGDATQKAKVISACDMPSGMSVKHYRSSGDIVDDYSQENMYMPYGLNLADPSTYQQEVTSSSQLALRAIRNPYYEMNLSNVIVGDVLPTPDSQMSNDGSAYVVQAVDVTPPIINITDIGANGQGGVALD